MHRLLDKDGKRGGDGPFEKITYTKYEHFFLKQLFTNRKEDGWKIIVGSYSVVALTNKTQSWCQD